MKNITAFAALVIIIFFPRPLSAQNIYNLPYAFSITPGFGFFCGQAEEIVYPSNTKAKYLSQLLWDIKPVAYYSLALDFSRTEPLAGGGFFSGLSLKNGIPGYSGKMEDRDWQSVVNTALTNYSQHDNMTKELFMVDFSAGYSFPLTGFMLLQAYLNAAYKRFSFSGYGGFYQYADAIPKNSNSGIYAPIANAPAMPIPTGERVINYTQDWMIFSPGVSCRLYVLRSFYANVSMQISPLIWCADLDEHLAMNDQYRDYTRGNLYIEPGLRVSYITGKWLEISLAGSWQKTFGAKGPAYKRSPIGQGYYSEVSEAGTGLSLWDVSLGARIRM